MYKFDFFSALHLRKMDNTQTIPNCVLCNYFDGKFKSPKAEDYSKVAQKGLSNLIKVSKERKDDFHVYLNDLQGSIFIHPLCRSKYINADCIEAACNVNKRKTENQNEPGRARLRSDNFDFDYLSNCIICGSTINEKNLKKVQVFQIKRPELGAEMLRLVENLEMKTTESIALKNRLLLEANLVEKKARYHAKCYMDLLNNGNSLGKKVGRPRDSTIDESMDVIFECIKNSDDCQFVYADFKEILEKKGKIVPELKTIKSRLRDKYTEEELLILTKKGGRTYFLLMESFIDILDERFARRKKSPEEQEILRKAAKIIRRDMRAEIFKNKEYPASDCFLDNIDNHIPDSLFYFLELIVLPANKDRWANKFKRISTAAHVIMSVARPRSFKSMLQLDLGVTLHRKFGSKDVIDLLYSLGLCCSYYEVKLYEVSLTMHYSLKIQDGAFIQIVYDNADFNTNTLNGKNTFHFLGCIIIVTPNGFILTREPIKRLEKIPSEAEIAAKGHVNLEIYNTIKKYGLWNIKIKECTDVLSLEPSYATKLNYFWLFLRYAYESSKVNGWNGYMDKITGSKIDYEVSKVVFAPFINAPPSDYDTLFTAAIEAIKTTQSYNMKTCILTFDQPLYMKMVDIIYSGSLEKEKLEKELGLNLPYDIKIIARLGGFHTVMSYMGCIGYIMAGSGLKELLCEIYAEKSVDHILTGHAYSRAVRAHTLVREALASLIFKDLEQTDLSMSNHKKKEIALNIYNDCSDPDMLLQNQSFNEIVNKFEDKIKFLDNKDNKTLQLWIMYFRMISVLNDFLYAERTGDWNLHLKSIQLMIPFFHVSGHLPYAKSATIYLQDMKDLKTTMDPSDYENFTTKGYWTVRRKDKYWSGNFTDQTIEQTLMKLLSVQGGPFKRGATDSVVFQWIQGAITTQDLLEGLLEYCGISFKKSEQHKDSTDTRQKVDAEALRKLKSYFETHNPFSYHELVSIATNVVADDRINVLEAFPKGVNIMSDIYKSKGNFRDLHLKKVNKVLTLQHMIGTLTVQDDVIPIEPNLIFQRISLIKATPEEKKHFFEYELSPYPQTLFDECGFRKNNKSDLYTYFEEITENLHDTEKFGYVIDGGMLLHQTKWKTGQMFSEIMDHYIKILKKTYGQCICVVFDGYNTPSIKAWERNRRKKNYFCAEYNINYSSKLQVAQEKFLSNSKNKARFIELFKARLIENNIFCTQAEGDADRLIVSTAMTNPFPDRRMVVVSQDIDVLLILTTLTSLLPDNQVFYFIKPVSSSLTVPEKAYSTNSLNNKLPNCIKHLLFLHAYSGCDTTSAFWGRGKRVFFEIFENFETLHALVEIFKQQNADIDKLIEVGIICTLALYRALDDEISKKLKFPDKLNYLRYIIFEKKTAEKMKEANKQQKKKVVTIDGNETTEKQKKTKKVKPVDLATLPPTADALGEHIKRVYYQVQEWLHPNNSLKPENYGWKNVQGILYPIKMNQPAAPENILNIIVCGCKTGCGKACGCRKNGIECSTACTHCHGSSCTNSSQVNEENDENPELVENGLHQNNINCVTSPEPILSESEDEIYIEDFFAGNESMLHLNSDV